MKIKRINDRNTKVWFTFACSQCEAEVDRGDRFCYNCGHKLSNLPDEVDMKKAADILTDALRKEPQAPAEADGKADDPDIGSDCTSSVGVATSDLTAWNAVVGLNRPHCMCGDHDPATCGHLRQSGACDVAICTSNPPQYPICPFRGHGFIPCKDA